MAKPRKQKPEDLDFQMEFYEDIIKDNSNFAEVLIALGEIYTKKGLYAKGLRVDKKLVKLRPESANAHYNLACSHSLLGDIVHSFKALKRALELGYDDFSFMNDDPDLLNLRQDDLFKELLGAFKKDRLKTEEVKEARG